MKIVKLLFVPLLAIALNSCSQKKNINDLSGDMFRGIEIRSIGPATYAGRISEILVDPRNDSVIYVAASTGGIFKTKDKGESWTPVFDQAGSSIAIGDMDISLRNPSLIWVGTGEASGEQNPASVGDGIYKSADGGQTWENMGLPESRHFSKVCIHPGNDSIVYAGASGSRWGSDENRGVYRTMDGGNSWEKVLFVNSNTGISDIAMHPDGKTIFASAWEQRRNAWGHVRQGSGSGLYMSLDRGNTWARVKNGLPQDKAGRIALAISESVPDRMYACYEHDSLGLFRSDDKGLTWENINNKVGTSYWYGRIYIDPVDKDHLYIMGTFIQESTDGGKNFKPVLPGRNVHVDHHILWIDPENTDNMLLGNDGGLYISSDKGGSWQFIANLPIGQYYDISVDNRDPYWIYGGLQDNGVWGGPSRSERGVPVSNNDIISISGGDGFYSDSEPEEPTLVYGESQYGNIVRFDMENQIRKRIKPRKPEEEEEYRFNWNTPFFVSNHSPHELYIGAQMVLKSTDRGNNWEEISPDLSDWYDLDSVLIIGEKPSRKPYFTITALAESPLKKGLLYAGTDDGKLYITRDDGKTWEDLSDSIPGKQDRFISRITPSKHIEGRAYIGFGRFYEASDLSAYIYVSNNYGKTWQDIGSDLPEKSVIRSIEEHPVNPDLLFVGTHNSLYVTINRGHSWVRPETNMPRVGVDDLVLQERENDLVIGTYGRGIWIIDNISFLSELKSEDLSEEHILFELKLSKSDINPDSTFIPEKYHFIAPDTEKGIMISYYLNTTYREGSKRYPVLSVANEEGLVTIIEDIPAQFGFNRIVWQADKPGKYTVTLESHRLESKRTINIKE